MKSLQDISWDWIKSFAAVAKYGSVLAAAKHLQTHPATISRQVNALEETLGISLFIRSRQGMQTTMAAMQFLQSATTMQLAMEELGLRAYSQNESLQGVVKISAGVVLANFILPNLLLGFRSLHPGIQLEIEASDAISDLVQLEADIAIRSVQPQQQSLTARRVAWLDLGLFANQNYLSKRGMPSFKLDSLLKHDFIDVNPQHSLRNGFSKAGLKQVEDRVSLIAGDHASAWQMVKAGLGIGSGFKIVAAQNEKIVQVLHEAPLQRLPVWLVAHKELKRQARVRVVMDYLAKAFNGLTCE